MKRILLSVLIAVLGLGFAATSAEAKRLGGGMSQGMKRTPPPAQTPAKSATPTAPVAPAAAPPAPAPRRSWMGPLAGLAAGLGIAALMSHFGMGGELASFMTIALLVVAGFFAVRWLMRRFMPAAPQNQGLQYAGAPSGQLSPLTPDAPAWRTAEPVMGPQTLASGAGPVPPGVDTLGLERAAKMIFIRMQAANDSANLDDLRQFSTPEMFAAFRLDLQDRKDAHQRTDVVQLDAKVVDWAEEAGQQIVSVRFHGLIREDTDGPAAPFDETWHLVRPTDGSREWAIAGIAQTAAA